jgi:hypothetical protein
MKFWSKALFLAQNTALLCAELGKAFAEGLPHGGVVFGAEEVLPEDFGVEGGEAEGGALGEGVGGWIGPGRGSLRGHAGIILLGGIILNLMK